ncbi:plastocyanin/azurin family copper-binding protein [Ornithinimicrobium murale]|uniref:plastocyanin/azurin family copper-binding protein n=1 Tax=Ornithinimicrobium murale TaxID=1050153 RepID=UPI000E0DCC96|nr:plastocyanin/azurin family copper-binding protein [Ornithinimicrobium murale]
MPLRQDNSHPHPPGRDAASPGRQIHGPISRPPLRRAAAAVLALGILPAVLSGCSGDDEPDSPAASVEDGAALITIADFEYATTGTIEPGAEVTVTNQDEVGHTVTSDEEGFFDVEVGPGETVTFTAPDEPGDYSYHCIPHPAMVSVLTVG